MAPAAALRKCGGSAVVHSLFIVASFVCRFGVGTFSHCFVVQNLVTFLVLLSS